MSLTFLRGQTRFMQQRGFTLAAVSSPGPDLLLFGEQLEIETRAIEMLRQISPLRDCGAIIRLIQYLREVRPSIVHAHTPKAGLVAMIASAIVGVPVRIYHMRGLPSTTARGFRKWALRLAESLACSLAHRVIAVSHSIRNIAIADELVSSSKIVVLHRGSGNGVDAEVRFNPALIGGDAGAGTRSVYGIPTDAVTIGFVGRITRDKGVYELAGAWAILRAEFPTLHLLLVGPIEESDTATRHVVESLLADSQVHYIGMDWNTPPLYAAMDIVALPSYREGFPNVPLEAAAMGIPVVATRVPGCVDAVVHKQTGILVEVGDESALAAALRDYVQDKHLRHTHGAAGRRRVIEDFKPEDVWDALYVNYRSLLTTNLESL